MKISSDSVLLGAWFLPPFTPAQTLLDIGAGSGLLALMAACILPAVEVTAIEIDSAAAKAAASNFERSPWGQRLVAVNCSFEDFHPKTNVDLIISNPPYFSNGAVSGDSARAAARHQQRLTYASLIDYAAGSLNPQGHLGLIAPAEVYDDILYRAELAGLKLRRLCLVAPTHRRQATRVLCDFSPSDGTCLQQDLLIRNDDGYTAEYRALVEPYYLTLK